MLKIQMDISKLKKEYSKKKRQIRQRLDEFGEQKDHFYELCFCLLTPQSNAFKCDQCITVLKGLDFLSRDIEINEILKKHTRFHNNKSKYLIRLKDKQEKIFADLAGIRDGKQKREYLVANIKGLGLKEASHFLRNTGQRDLAILDRHILKNLVKLKVLKDMPKTLTKKNYLEIEERFEAFADEIGIPMDELDLLFWSMETGRIFK